MTIADVAIRRPITVCMTFVGIILLGVFASQMLPLELFPQVEVPFVGLSIPYPNATPEEVEKNITRPVEEALATMSGIQEMHTTSRDGYAFVRLILDFKRDVAHKGVEAKELIESIRHLLPNDVRRVLLREEGPDQIPMLNLVISTDMDLNQAYNLLEARLVRALERVPGVNSVNLFGIDKRYVQISLRNDRLGAHNLDINTIRDRLARQNFIVSAGTITADGMRMRVHPIGIYESLQSIRDLPLDTPGLHLGDVADVAWATRENRDRRRVNGRRAIGLSVHKEAEANLVSV
ncbi:MAG: efflux RND transporter permease subunit, partial [Pseudomonadales bacterium]